MEEEEKPLFSRVGERDRERYDLEEEDEKPFLFGAGEKERKR